MEPGRTDPSPAASGREAVSRVRAFVHDPYGHPEVLRLEEVEPPVPKENEVLVRVHATSFTRTDVLLLKEVIEAGKYRAVIDRTYSLDDVVEATRYVETLQKNGNVVSAVVDDRPGEHEASTEGRREEVRA